MRCARPDGARPLLRAQGRPSSRLTSPGCTPPGPTSPPSTSCWPGPRPPPTASPTCATRSSRPSSSPKRRHRRPIPGGTPPPGANRRAGAPETEPDAYLRHWYAPRPAPALAYPRRHRRRRVPLPRPLTGDPLPRARSARPHDTLRAGLPPRPPAGALLVPQAPPGVRPAQEALGFLRRYSVDTLRRVESFAAVRTECQVSVTHADGRSAAFPAAHGIITSPLRGTDRLPPAARLRLPPAGPDQPRGQEIGAPDAGASRARAPALPGGRGPRAAPRRRRPPRRGAGAGGRADRHHLYPEIAALAGPRAPRCPPAPGEPPTGRRAGDFYESVFVWRKP